MVPTTSPFPPGLIVVVSSDLSRYPDFMQCLLRLAVPEGSHWEWSSGTSIDANRNLAITKLRDNERWVYTIDDDHEFAPDTLLQLLSRMGSVKDIDILQGLCNTRKPPYLPYAYRRDPDYHGYGVNYINASWDELPTSGVSEWDACGTGGMLIRRKVIDKMKYPWFEIGKTFKDALGEDLYFCTKAKELGFRVWVDSDTRTGHITKATAWPEIDPEDGRWMIGLDVKHGVKLAVPQEIWANAKFDEIRVPVDGA